MGLTVIDISNPSAPVAVASLGTAGSARDVAVASGYAYVADWDGGLRVFDVRVATSPTEVGFYQTSGLALGVAASGGYAYVSELYFGFEVFQGCEFMFFDGFESGDISEWSAAVP